MRAALVLAAALALAACNGGAKELLDTAAFEELQRNTAHARELYQEVVRKHPGTPEAARAKARLAALDAAG